MHDDDSIVAMVAIELEREAFDIFELTCLVWSDGTKCSISHSPHGNKLLVQTGEPRTTTCFACQPFRHYF